MIRVLSASLAIAAMPAYGFDPSTLPEPHRTCYFRGAFAGMYMAHRQTSSASLQDWLRAIDAVESESGSDAADVARRHLREAYRLPRFHDQARVAQAVADFDKKEVQTCYREHGLEIGPPQSRRITPGR